MNRKKRIEDNIRNLTIISAAHVNRISSLEDANDSLDKNLTEAFNVEHEARANLGGRIKNLAERIVLHKNFFVNHNRLIKLNQDDIKFIYADLRQQINMLRDEIEICQSALQIHANFMDKIKEELDEHKSKPIRKSRAKKQTNRKS